MLEIYMRFSTGEDIQNTFLVSDFERYKKRCTPSADLTAFIGESRKIHGFFTI